MVTDEPSKVANRAIAWSTRPTFLILLLKIRDSPTTERDAQSFGLTPTSSNRATSDPLRGGALSVVNLADHVLRVAFTNDFETLQPVIAINQLRELSWIESATVSRT